MAQELSDSKPSMEVDGGSTPLPPSNIGEEVYKMGRETLELLRELHIQGACQERGEYLRKRLAELDDLVSAVKKKAKRSVMTEMQNQRSR